MKILAALDLTGFFRSMSMEIAGCMVVLLVIAGVVWVLSRFVEDDEERVLINRIAVTVGVIALAILVTTAALRFSANRMPRSDLRESGYGHREEQLQKKWHNAAPKEQER